MNNSSQSNPIIGRGWQFPPNLDERGTVALAGGENEIEQAIRIILGTAPGQRVMRPDFGCRIQELVFAPNNATTAGLAARYVEEALGRWEPRIEVRQVNILQPERGDEGRLQIAVEYRVLAQHSNRSLVFPFYLIPEDGSKTEIIQARQEVSR